MRLTPTSVANVLGFSGLRNIVKNLTVAGACYTCGIDVNDPKRKKCLYMNAYI